MDHSNAALEHNSPISGVVGQEKSEQHDPSFATCQLNRTAVTAESAVCHMIRFEHRWSLA
jgi:hypothetical protein